MDSREKREMCNSNDSNDSKRQKYARCTTRISPKLAVGTALVERMALCTSMKRSEPLPAMWIRVARAVPELIQQVARPSHAQLPLMLPESLGHSSRAQLLRALVVRMKETMSPPHLHIAPYLPEAPFE